MDETSSEQLTHEQRVARLLELEEAREARRAARVSRWRALAPLILAVLIFGGIGGAFWWNHVQEQQRSDERVCEMFSEMSGAEQDC